MPQRNKVIYDISNKPFADEHEFQVWLESQHGKEAFEPDLLRILKILKNLIKEISQNSKIITVCGTNGKGETVGFVSRFLSDEKKTFCSWTSPHILSLRERFISNNEMIKMRDFNTVIFKVMGKCNEERVKLSYYEFLFACFVFYTHQEMPEFILLEVGLGGRLDAVNIFDADLVLLTSISRDHQQFLGNRYDQILKEKLGVLRENKSLICGAQSNYINELSEKYAKSINSKFTSLLKTKKSYRDLDFSRANHYLAIKCCQELGLELNLNSIKNVQLSFRGKKYSNGSQLITFFGSHNPQGVRKLVQLLETSHYNESNKYDIALVAFSDRNEDDLKCMLKSIKLKSDSIARKIYLSRFDHFRALKNTSIFNAFESEKVEILLDWKKLFEENKYSNKKIIVFGSNFFISEVARYINI